MLGSDLLTSVISILASWGKTLQVNRFNIFKTLQLQNSEVWLHSNLIAELLNPEGTHGKGDLFLKLFISDILKINDFDFNKAQVSREVPIGIIDENYLTGGTLDIIIENGTKTIMIENKIYAVDQKNQLLRYHNKKPEATLFYLTLDGHEPSNFSTNGELIVNKDFFLLSYKEHILPWISNCLKECKEEPRLYEIIFQYRETIKDLIGMGMEDQLIDAIAKEITRNEDNLSAAFAVNASLAKVKDTLIDDLILQLQAYAGTNSILFEIDGTFCTKDEGVKLYKNTWNDYYIGFAFNNNNMNGMQYGIIKFRNGKPLTDNQRIILDKNLNGGMEGSMWVKYFNFEYLNWSNDKEPWIAIKNGSMLKMMQEHINKLIPIIDEMESKQ